jgi:putative ATP-binding cassette transporter
MIFVKFVLRSFRGMMIVVSLAALLSGACNAGLIAMVNMAINSPGKTATGIVIAFVALGLGRLVTSLLSQMLSIRFVQGAITNLRQDLVRSILAAPLRQLEQIGAARLLVALTDDIYHITQALLGIPLIAVNGALLLGGAVYLGWLAWPVLLGLMALIVAGALGYRLIMGGAYRALLSAREEEDKLFGCFRALTEGIKELKLHRDRRGVFLADNVDHTTGAYQRHNVAAEDRFILAQHWSHLLFYALIGVLLFVLPEIMAISTEALTGYVITTLYLMGPLAGVLSTFSLFGRANVALGKIQELGMTLNANVQDRCPVEQTGAKLEFESLELIGVHHAYHTEKEDSQFSLGPLNLRFVPGELVFIVGGNGSGKSTLAKIIAGLYPPEQGEIRVNDEAVTDQNRDDYRQLFSAVFGDFYLFDTLLGVDPVNLDLQAHGYLARLHLDHKVTVQNGRFSTIDLSQGQRKRLALLTAYLEDRPIYLFDEWASDQDPLFKELFYEELLPDLKARGKAVIAITHDDRYFHVADRVIKLDYGRLVYDEGPAQAVAELEPAHNGNLIPPPRVLRL